VPPEDQLSSEFNIEQKGLGIFKYKKGARPIPLPKFKSAPVIEEEPKRDSPYYRME